MVGLNSEQQADIARLGGKLDARRNKDALHSRYYEGTNRLAHIGLQVPPELQKLEVVINWPGMVVDTIENRQDVKSLLLPGEDKADGHLLDLWTCNNMDTEMPLLCRDVLIYGRGFVSVGANPVDTELPVVMVESPLEMEVEMDPRTRAPRKALRRWDFDDSDQPQRLTLYGVDETVWMVKSRYGWTVEDVDVHGLGQVPIIPFWNTRKSGSWDGRSEMARIIPLVDVASRTLTNMQVAAEAMAIPKRWATGVSKGDFVDKDGKPLPVWNAYAQTLWATTNEKATFGQLSAADLRNFHETVNHLGQQAAALTGFPAKYFGQYTTNPPAEGAIRAEEAQMVKKIERKNAEIGNSLGHVLGLALRLAGREVDGNRIRVEWHDPGTPTFAQRADALQKLAGGRPLISREGVWDELGWSDARKEQERAYFLAEETAEVESLTGFKPEIVA